MRKVIAICCAVACIAGLSGCATINKMKCEELNKKAKENIHELAIALTVDSDEEKTAILFGSMLGHTEAAIIFGCKCTD